MTLRERIAKLDPRERRLLQMLGVLAAAMIVLGLPLTVLFAVSAKRADNARYEEIIEAIHDDQDRILARTADHDTLLARYENPAPPLASFLDEIAKAHQIEIPESQDRAPIPHGKAYEERATKLSLQKVGMLALARFLERIETSHHPVSISSLNIRKRGGEPDSYDVTIVVSAFDRKADKPAAPAASGEPAEGSEDEAP